MARFLKIGGIVFSGVLFTGVLASATAPAFAGAPHGGGGGGHMVGHPGMAGHRGWASNRPNPFPHGNGNAYAPPRGRQGYDYGYALPHGRPGYDFGYALPYGGSYRGWGYGAVYGGGGGYYDPGYGAYGVGAAPGTIIIAPTAAIYGPPYPIGYYGASYTPTGNGVIYNLPFAQPRYPSKIIYLSDGRGQTGTVHHVTVIRAGVSSDE
jgi:hypothetical protein